MLVLHRHVIRPRPLDREALEKLFRIVEEEVAQGIRVHGAGGNYPPVPGKEREQRFYHSQGGDVDLSLENVGVYTLEWGQIQDILRGLKLWMVTGKRPYETEYEAVVGPRVIHYLGIARGKVGRAGLRVEQS